MLNVPSLSNEHLINASQRHIFNIYFTCVSPSSTVVDSKWEWIRARVCAVHSSVSLVHRTMVVNEFRSRHQRTQKALRDLCCFRSFNETILCATFMKHFSGPYLWFLTDVLRGEISGLWMQSNLEKKSRKAGFGNIFTPFLCPDFIYGLCLCALRCSMRRRAERTIVDAIFWHYGKDCDPGRFILVVAVARMGSDMKEPQKNVSISCRLWLRNP